MVVESVLLVAQQGAGPVGSEFGKASPIGWFVIVAQLDAAMAEAGVLDQRKLGWF